MLVFTVVEFNVISEGVIAGATSNWFLVRLNRMVALKSGHFEY